MQEDKQPLSKLCDRLDRRIQKGYNALKDIEETLAKNKELLEETKKFISSIRLAN